MNKGELIGLSPKQQENRKEDKKAIKKFIITFFAAFCAGIGIGVVGVFADAVLENASVKDTILQVMRILAVYGGYGFTTALLAACMILYKKSRREYSSWDEEDEDVLQRIETRLSYGLWFSSLTMFSAYFFFTVGVWAVDIANVKCAIKEDPAGFGISIGVVFGHMVYALLASLISQQKLVNLAKEINPEKKGSIYDTKFQDKWLANCDEAERFTVYKCSFKTYKVMQLTGMILWIICLLGQVIFGTGAFATIIVTIFLIIQTSVYSVQAIYFAKHPSEVMK